VRFILLAGFVWWLVRQAGLPAPHADGFARMFHLGHFLWLGVPIALIAGMESFLFSGISVMSGWLGPVALAAYQMLMGWIGIPFVISLGLADAATVRVSFWTGARSHLAARQAGIIAMVAGVGLPLLLVIVPLTMPDMIARFFLDPHDAGFSDVSRLLSSLLIIGAFFQVFDGLQVIASHALRGVKDTRVPLAICGFGYWIAGIPIAYLFAFRFGWGAQGLWWGVALGLGITALMLTTRFVRLTQQPAAS
jgi:MATE family multidrug resistance protein